MIDIPFPQSSKPGQRPGEGQGSLINAFCEMDGTTATWRPVPGLVDFANTATALPRGMIDKDGILYACGDNSVLTVTPNAFVSLLTGSMPGSTPVTWARNNKAPTADLVCVADGGCYSVSATTITPFADPDLPAVNSVCDMNGYLIWTTPSGQVYASDLNSVSVNPLSLVYCQSKPDGLLRGTSQGSQFFAWGQASCEVYQDQGLTPFPLARVTTIAIGLLDTWCIAGFELGWSQNQIFVAADRTVRMMDGYKPVTISTKDVERDIQAVVATSQLRASVYVVAGHPIWSLSSPTWTWEYNTSTNFWHKRQSFGLPRWRASTSCMFAGKWIVGDTGSTFLLSVTEAAYLDRDTAIAMTLESAPIKDFPQRVRVNLAEFDFTTGQGGLLGSDDEVNPKVSVSWSFDGGATWGNPIVGLSLGGMGQFTNRIRVNRIGLSTHHGVRFRLVTSSPVYRTFRGGRCEIEARKPA